MSTYRKPQAADLAAVMNEAVESVRTDALQPGPSELTYRLTGLTGSSISVRPTLDDHLGIELATQLATKALALVDEAFFTFRGKLTVELLADLTPEILTQATLDRIAALESALNACRNAMIEVAGEGRWKALIDDAAHALDG